MRTALLLLLLFAPGAAPPGAVLERVSFSVGGSALVVRIQGAGGFGAYSVPAVEGERVEMVLFNTALSPRFRADAPTGLVTGVETLREGRHLRLRFALRAPARADVAQDGAAGDLLLTLRPAGQEAVDERVVTPEAPAPVGTSAPAEAGTRWRFDTVVIDAGHGGHDTGTQGNGLREKDITLAVARQVGAYLEKELGVRVVYTRQDDRFITLRNRGRIANEARGKLFVSIHVNSAPGAGGRRAQGTETYFLGLHKNDAARAVMERENAVVRLEEDPDAYADYDEEALIMRTLANTLYLRKSERLAGLVEKQFEERVGRQSRGVKQAGFLVLWGASMPAVLVELGFLSNPAEARFLGSARGQDYLASAIFRAIRDLKTEYEHDLETSSSFR